MISWVLVARYRPRLYTGRHPKSVPNEILIMRASDLNSWPLLGVPTAFSAEESFHLFLLRGLRGTFTAGLCIYQGKHRNGSLRGTIATLSVYSIVPDQVLPGTAKPQGSHASFKYQGHTMRRRHSPQQSCIYSSIYSGQCLTTTTNQFHPSARVCRLKCTHPINPTFLLVRCIRL